MTTTSKGGVQASDEAKARACELLNAEQPPEYEPFERDEEHFVTLAFARFIQEVSDAAKKADAVAERNGFEPRSVLREQFAPFILPEPAADPLADAVERVLAGFENRAHATEYADAIRAELAERGLEIREVRS